MRLSLALAVLGIFGAAPLVKTAPPRASRAKRTGLSLPCSRIESRAVRNRFDAYVRKMDKGSVSIPWPDKCPFSPFVDVFGWHEKNKSRASAGSVNSRLEWRCNYTGKVFKNEHYLDLHMERMYMDEMPKNGTCLEDYCEVFDFCKVNETSFFELLSAEPPPCDLLKMERLKGMCENTVDLCLPYSEPEKQEFNAQLHSTFCDRLTCEARAVSHAHRRKWSLIIGVLFLSIIVGVFFLCMCVELPEGHDSDANNPTQMRRKHMHGGRATDIRNRHTIGKHEEPRHTRIDVPPNLNKNKFE